MPLVITENANVQCAHTGTITPKASQQKLTVGKVAVLLAGDMMGKAVAPNCTNLTNTTTGTKQCTAVASEIGVIATKLKVNGKGVLLAASNGLTDGLIPPLPQTWSVKAAGQSKLKAM